MTSQQRPVRVLYCESNVDGTVGGSHSCLLNLVANVDRRRFEPLVVFYEAHSLIDRFKAVATTMVLPQDTPVRWGERQQGLLALPMVAARRGVNAVARLRSIAEKTTFLHEQRIGLVHLNNSITRHHEWMWAARRAGIPCVVHERGLPTYGAADRYWARRLKLIVPVSRWVAGAMVAQGVTPENIRVMYDGVDPGGLPIERSPDVLRNELGIDPGQPVVGIVGNVREWKGQETVVHALRTVAARYPELVCLFVGSITPADAAFKQKLDAIIRDHGLEPNVRFTGYQRDVPSFVNLMQFVLHASVVAEPFGMVVLEAMAQRKAVIGSRAGGVVEMVEEGVTGYTVPAGDAEDMAARVLELLDDPAKARTFGERGHQRLIEHFSLRRYINDVESAYEAVLAGKPVTTGLAPHHAEATGGGSH